VTEIYEEIPPEETQKARELIERFKAGDELALKQLMSIYDELILKAYRIRLGKHGLKSWLRINSSDLEDDIKSEVWSEFAQAVKTGKYDLQTKEPEHFIWYLSTIKTVNWMRRSLRKRRWKAAESWRGDGAKARRNFSFTALKRAEDKSNFQDEAFELSLADEFIAKVSSLTKEDQSIVAAVTEGKEAGLTKEEIAANLGISTKTLYNRQQKIKRFLTEEF
tara:strand:+ start:1181 stop:1843 length:663 start_codon:yes stop_codon:yes gene_type:complete